MICAIIHTSEVLAYDVDIIEKPVVALSVKEDSPQVDVCVFSDVGTAPRIRTATVEVFQEAETRLKTPVKLDERGCHSLVLRDIEGEVHIRVEYPGDAWSARILSEMDARIVVKNEEPVEEEIAQTQDGPARQPYRYRYIGIAIMSFLWIALGYRYRKQILRLLRRLGIMKTPIPALPNDIQLQADKPVPRQKENDAVGKDTAQTGGARRQSVPLEASSALLRAHIAACFNAVVQSVGEDDGWGNITPSAFAREYGTQLSERDAQLLDSFCLDVEKYAFDPASVLTQQEVINIHQMAERLARRLA